MKNSKIEKLRDKAFNISEALADALSVLRDLVSKRNEIKKLENLSLKVRIEEILRLDKHIYKNYADLNEEELEIDINKNNEHLIKALNILKELMENNIDINKIEDEQLKRNIKFVLSNEFFNMFNGTNDKI